MNRTKIIIFSLLLLVLSAGGFFGYRFFTKAITKLDNPFDAIPVNNAFVLKVSDFPVLEDAVSADSSLLSSLFTAETLDSLRDSWTGILKSIKENKSLAPAYQKSAVYISCHFMGLDKFAYLFSVPLMNFDGDDLAKILKKKGTLTQSDFEGFTIYKFIGKKGRSFFFTVNKSLISASASRMLIEKVIYTLKSDKRNSSDPLTAKLLKISGDSKMNLYVNYKYFYRFLSAFAPDYRDEVKHFGSLAEKAELDVNLSDNHLFMTGYSIYSDSSDSYLGRFAGFKPVSVSMFDILPYNTMLLNYTGVSDFAGLYDKISSYFDDKSHTAVGAMEKKYSFDLHENILSWVNKEAAFCITSCDYENAADHSFAVFSCTDIKEAEQQLGRIAVRAAEVHNLTPDTVFYRSYAIRNIGIPYFIPKVFGSVYDKLQHGFYVTVGNYVVFANSQAALRSFIDTYLIGKTLASDSHFKEFSKLLSDKINKFLYFNMKYYGRYFSHFTKNSLIDFKKIGFTPGNIGAIALEFSTAENGTYTSVAMDFGYSEDEDEEPVSWQEALDAKALGRPYIITNHTNGAREVLIFDNQNSLYRIDSKGKIAWKIPLLEAPKSDIYMLDFYKNGKYQYVFNTSNYIYIVDLNGNRVDEYPFKLPVTATGKMSLMDYDRVKNYRILIPLEDGKLHNFRLDQTETPGWVNPVFSRAYLTPVEHFRLRTKDFLLFADTLGNVTFANRKGEARMEAKLAFTNNYRTGFAKIGKGSMARLVTTDLMGRAVEIDADGNVDKISLSDFSPGHKFLLCDFDLDGNKDFVYFDRNRLQIFSQNKKKLLDTLFSEQNIDRIVPVDFVSADSIRLVLRDKNDNSLFFITSTGAVKGEKEFVSSGDFIVEQATKKGFLRLITVNNRVISNFLIK